MDVEFFLGADPPQFAPIAQDVRTDVGAARPDECAILHGGFPKLLGALQRRKNPSAQRWQKIKRSGKTVAELQPDTRRAGDFAVDDLWNRFHHVLIIAEVRWIARAADGVPAAIVS